MKIAIVTGAGSGMGKEFALKLKNEELDEIWAISLENEDLFELTKLMHIKVNEKLMDLSNLDNLNKLQDEILKTSPHILWLINCAGFGKFDDYDNIKTETNLNMIDVNCKAMVKLVDMCLPYMKKGSRIVNFASVAGFQPVPYITMYASTKAFVLSYSRALGTELKHKGISVTCVSPYWTKTKFFKRAVNKENVIVKNYIVMYKPKKVIDKAYKDSLNRKALSIYGFVANVQVLLAKLLPASFVQSVWIKQQKLDKKQ